MRGPIGGSGRGTKTFGQLRMWSYHSGVGWSRIWRTVEKNSEREIHPLKSKVMRMDAVSALKFDCDVPGNATAQMCFGWM